MLQMQSSVWNALIKKTIQGTKSLFSFKVNSHEDPISYDYLTDNTKFDLHVGSGFLSIVMLKWCLYRKPTNTI